MHYFSETLISSSGQRFVAFATGLTLFATSARWLTAKVRAAIARVPTNQSSQTPTTPDEWRLFQQAPLAAIAWNVNGEITQWNHSATQIFGYSPQDAIGQQAASLIVPAHVR